MSIDITGFGTVLLFLIGGLIFISAGLLTARLLRPHRPNPEKLSTYECGEEPEGSAWGRFNFRFYVIALVFILFDVEIVFLFPWATVLGDPERMQATQGQWGNFALVEMLIFVGVLALGLIYVWANGMLDWIRPSVNLPKNKNPVPMQMYEEVNDRFSSHSPISQNPIELDS